MDQVCDKNFQLTMVIVLISFVNIYDISYLSYFKNLFRNGIFIFLLTFGFSYRAYENIEISLFLSGLITLILLCMNKYEYFKAQNIFKINFNDEEPLILDEGVYSLKGSQKLPIRITNDFDKITSFEIDDNYNVLITKVGAYPVNYQGKFIVQDINPLENIEKIEIQKTA
jgi:hypothetical protein